MLIARIIGGLWLLFALSWLVAAFWSSTVAKRVGLVKELGYRIVLIAGGILLFIPAHGYEGPWRLWFVTRDEAWVCVGLIALGFAFAWWARIYLGPLWSGQVTTKADHHVVDRGPYGIVRHPIYTGIYISYVALALQSCTALNALIFATGIALFVVKSFVEEGFLSQDPQYTAYMARVRWRWLPYVA